MQSKAHAQGNCRAHLRPRLRGAHYPILHPAKSCYMLPPPSNLPYHLAFIQQHPSPPPLAHLLPLSILIKPHSVWLYVCVLDKFNEGALKF